MSALVVGRLDDRLGEGHTQVVCVGQLPVVQALQEDAKRGNKREDFEKQ